MLSTHITAKGVGFLISENTTRVRRWQWTNRLAPLLLTTKTVNSLRQTHASILTAHTRARQGGQATSQAPR